MNKEGDEMSYVPFLPVEVMESVIGLCGHNHLVENCDLYRDEEKYRKIFQRVYKKTPAAYQYTKWTTSDYFQQKYHTSKVNETFGYEKGSVFHRYSRTIKMGEEVENLIISDYYDGNRITRILEGGTLLEKNDRKLYDAYYREHITPREQEYAVLYDLFQEKWTFTYQTYQQQRNEYFVDLLINEYPTTVNMQPDQPIKIWIENMTDLPVQSHELQTAVANFITEETPVRLAWLFT